ncbi:MAG TPA: aminotransferase class I/II-fold pyridoxal phosphate-dependent enzyme, partial [Caldilineaceae bacterium]|nr:aminotransferase class I/II-fold pyridoxal phosphate-dependent enzyme [Caldilineaceae bacterium]
VIERSERIEFPAARLLYLSNPHNPTGHWLPAVDWPELPLVVVDEAYRPFLADPVEWPAWPNVIRVQSPGKAHGLLGLRLAYALTTPALAAHLLNLQPAWAIPGPLAEVLAALPEQDAFLRQTLPQVRRWAGELAAHLGATAHGVHFFTLAHPRAAQITAALSTQNIRVRHCASFGLPDRIRIATRTPEQNARLVAALEEVNRQFTFG